MKNKDIVFITSKDDEHTDYMIDYFYKNHKNISVIRLNTEDFATNTKVIFDGNKIVIDILDSKRQIDSSKVHSVVYRRPKKIEVEHIDDNYISKFVFKQFDAFLRGFYFFTHDSALWVNPLPSLHRARDKFQQLQLAQQLDLTIPKTLITNRIDEVKKFMKNINIVCTKSLSEPSFVTDGYIFPLYTKIINKDKLFDNIESIELAPTLFQEYIEKKYDIRVVVIKDKVFAVEIHSQEHPDSKIDFRGAITDITHKIHQLPNNIEKKLIEFVKQQKLYYSAFDLVLSKKGDYYFIENNPNGQWLWLEYDAGVKISEYYADFLINH